MTRSHPVHPAGELPVPPGLPEEALGFVRERGYLRPDELRAGDLAPDVRLYPLEPGDGAARPLSAWTAGRPAILVFGSYT